MEMEMEIEIERVVQNSIEKDQERGARAREELSRKSICSVQKN